MNKFEWVSGDGYKKSLAGGWCKGGGAMSDVQEGEVQCIMGDGHVGTPTVNRQT